MKRVLCLMLVVGAIVGCEAVREPSAEVARVAVTERSPEGARVEVTVMLSNPNDVPLPLRGARYDVVVDGREFAYTGMPPVTLPPGGQEPITLAAAFADGEAVGGQSVAVAGRVWYEPPGEIRELATQYQIPLPSVPFRGRGALAEPARE